MLKSENFPRIFGQVDEKYVRYVGYCHQGNRSNTPNSAGDFSHSNLYHAPVGSASIGNCEWGIMRVTLLLY